MCLLTLIGVFIFSPLVSAAALLSPSTPPKYMPQTLPVLLSPSNITNTFSPSSNALRIQCNANYGRDLNSGSCRDIFTYIKKSDEQYTFSERHTGRPNDLPLPHRTLSNDGLCFLQPLLVPGAVTAKASMTQIGQAAYVLFQACVVKRGLGGIAADIGGDNNLNVVVADYAPHVRCDKSPTSGPPWKSCLAIVADMKATRDRQVFGNKDRDPRVEVHVPHIYKAIDARCQLSVEITGKSTTASWYEIWEAVTALTAMCVRDQDKGGKAYGIGLRKNIFVQMSDENPDLSQPTANVANVSALAPLVGLDASDSSSGVGQPHWAPAPFIEVSTGPVQGSSSLSIVSGDATS